MINYLYQSVYGLKDSGSSFLSVSVKFSNIFHGNNFLCLCHFGVQKMKKTKRWLNALVYCIKRQKRNNEEIEIVNGRDD